MKCIIPSNTDLNDPPGCHRMVGISPFPCFGPRSLQKSFVWMGFDSATGESNCLKLLCMCTPIHTCICVSLQSKACFFFFFPILFQLMRLLKGFLNEQYKQTTDSQQKGNLGHMGISQLSQTIFRSSKSTHTHPSQTRLYLGWAIVLMR